MNETAVEGYELSFQQKSYFEQREKKQSAFNQCLILIEGALDREFLRQAVESVIKEHEIWRTSFRQIPGMSIPIQVIEDEFSVEIERIDVSEKIDFSRRLSLTGIPPSEEGGLETSVFKLMSLEDGSHFLLVSTQAMASDEKTFFNFTRQLADQYQSLVQPVYREEASAPIQYVDFSQWQSSLWEEQEAESYRNFWKNKIEELKALPKVELDLREIGETGEREDRLISTVLDRKTTVHLEDVARQTGVSKELLLLAAWQILLSRLSKTSEIVINVLADGRGLENLETAFGLYARYLPFYAHVQDRADFQDYLAGLCSDWERAYENQYYFTGDERKAVDAASEPPASKFYFGYFNCQPITSAQGPRFSVHDFQCRYAPSGLRLEAFENGDVLMLKMYYPAGSFSAIAARRMIRMLETLLAGLPAGNGLKLAGLQIIPAEEKSILLNEFNSPAVDFAPACLHRTFEERAAAQPSVAAVAGQGNEITFGELNRRANRLGNFLSKEGVRPESLVGVLLEKSGSLIETILALWKTGGIYVPLDVSSPKDRLKKLVESNQVEKVVSLTRHRELLSGVSTQVFFLDEEEQRIDREDGENLSFEASPENAAYVIYTSGSTGIPKGVVISHRSVTNLLAGLRKNIYRHLSFPLRIAVNAPIVFDASIKQLIQLLDGHTLVPIPEDVRLDPEALASFIRDERVEVFDCTPSQLNLLMNTKLFESSSGAVLQGVLIGGEKIGEGLWQRLASTENIEFFNVYGPTECTVDTTVKKIEKSAPPTIGTPLQNVQVYLLDEKLDLAPIGVKSEIFIAGEGVARGYLNDPEKTAVKFIPNPYAGRSGERMYRSGDAGRYRSDGSIEFLGRLDRQVKIRGYRVEPGEIEKALESHPGIQEAAVVHREENIDNANLTAYYVLKRRFREQIDGFQRYELPNKLSIAHQNKNETDYLYEEIFEKQIYFQKGIQIDESSCIVDVGANIGMFTLFVLQQNPKAKIFAFEALPPIFEKLRLNIELYGENVKIFPLGIANESKTDVFTFYPQYSMMSGLSRYASSQADVGVIETYLKNQNRLGSIEAESLLTHADSLILPRFEERQDIKVELITLSEFIAAENIETIDLLKIDVQRAEMDVLKGIDPEDWNKIQQVVMEVHDAEGEQSAGRVKEIGRLLQEYGFRTFAEQDEIMKGTDRFNLYASRKESFLQDSPADISASRAASEKQASLAEKAYPVRPSHLKDFLREKLPEYMIPNFFSALEKMPLNENGKVDRSALPAPNTEKTTSKNYVSPTTALEKEIALIWQEVLKLERIGIYDNFFDLGGHSLLIVQLHSQIRQKLNCELAMVELFQYPTVHALAQKIGNGSRDGMIIDRAAARANKQREMMSKQKKLRRV